MIQPGFSAYDKEEMEDLLEEVKALVPTAQLRGMKEG